MIDTHMHCNHSNDTNVDPREMINAAIEKGMQYIAFTDHCDRDYKCCLPMFRDVEQIDLHKHISEILELKEIFADKIEIALGLECGFANEATNDYITDLAATQNWDIILNSVHTVEGEDCYFPIYFDKRDKKKAYADYLQKVLESLNVPYIYNSVAHLGYVTRKAVYDDRKLYICEHRDIIDEILKSIIEKDVSLELNTHCKDADPICLPHFDIVDRYIELGGENFTFGSDAHQPNRVGDGYEKVASRLKERGIKYFDKYLNRKRIKVKI